MNYSFVAYILISICAISGSYYINSNAGYNVQAILLSLGFLALSIYFGILWFTPTGESKINGASGAWPPSIQMCPDYLSIFRINGQPVCVDPVGVSTGGLMKKWTGSQTDASYTFPLTDSQGTPLAVKALCDQCKAKGVTWEGVWDGTVCLGNKPPFPPTSAVLAK
jgi:hypothetical protein